MGIDPKLLSGLSPEQERYLVLCSNEEFGALIKDNLEQWVGRSYADLDELLYAGATVGRLRPEGADRYVEQWLDLNLSAKRFDIASLFLWGYWPFSIRPVKSLVMKLSSALNEIPNDSSAYGSILLALSAVYKTAEKLLSPTEVSLMHSNIETAVKKLRTSKSSKGIIDALEGKFLK